MENMYNLWVFYTQKGYEKTVVAVKRCKHPDRTKVWRELPNIARESGSTVYGYSLIESPEGTEFICTVLGEFRCFKFTKTAWGDKLQIYHNGLWEFCDYVLNQYIFIK